MYISIRKLRDMTDTKFILDALKELNGMFDDDLRNAIREENRTIREEKKRKELEKVTKFMNGTTFTIEKYYLKSNDIHGLFDECVVSDPDTATELFKRYRKIGHSLRLRKLVITVDGETFYKVNFKYNAPELNEL